MTHTQAPWKVINCGKHWNNDKIYNYQIENNDGKCITEHVYEKSDAQLIATAPELFYICNKLVDLKDLWLLNDNISIEHKGEAETLQLMFDELIRVILKVNDI